MMAPKVEEDNILVEQGINGFIYDYGDLKELKEKLLYLIENKKINQQMQKENLKRSKELINEDITWNYLEKIYKEVLTK